VSEDLHLAPYFCDDALDRGEVQTMARRQFGASLVVGLAFLAAALLVGLNASHETAPAAAAQSAMSRPALAPAARALQGRG
jgi:hypothetical protein